MSDGSSIEWTDATWNPVRGCTKISPGCKHCYAETFAERFRGVPGHPYEQGFDPRLVPSKLDEPLHWRKPRLVFANSMSDLFHKDFPNEYIAACYGVMLMASQHTYQCLTKRAARLPQFYRWIETASKDYRARCRDLAKANGGRIDPDPRVMLCVDLAEKHGVIGYPNLASATYAGDSWPPRSVWVGVSVENRKHGLPRIDELRKVDAAVRFLSIEPLLEDIGKIDLAGIGWVIVGGESGPGARGMDPAWVRSLRDQCIDAGVPFFFKQWGGLRKKIAGRVLDGKIYSEMPT